MTSIDIGNQLILDAIRGRFQGGDLDGAITIARANGVALKPDMVPTPATDRVMQLRREGRESAAQTIETMQGEQLAKEAEARARVAEIASGAGGALSGLPHAEKIEKIMQRSAGLSHLDSARTLIEIGE